MSAKTGVAPRRIAPAVAKKVKAVVMTSSPGPMPSAQASRRRRCLRRSRWRPSLPGTHRLRLRGGDVGAPNEVLAGPTSAITGSSSLWSAAYCALRSRRGRTFGFLGWGPRPATPPTTTAGTPRPSAAQRRIWGQFAGTVSSSGRPVQMPQPAAQADCEPDAHDEDPGRRGSSRASAPRTWVSRAAAERERGGQLASASASIKRVRACSASVM